MEAQGSSVQVLCLSLSRGAGGHLLGKADAARVLVEDEEALGAEARVVGVVALGAQVAAANTTPARP